MNLKESYRYMNYLTDLYNTASGYLHDKSFITKVKEEHFKNKANVEAEDEIIEKDLSSEYGFSPNQVINFINELLTEKDKLSTAIHKAKSSADIDIDHAISMNKQKQSFVKQLKSMANIKTQEVDTSAYGQKFNAEGNQVNYMYKVKRVTSINFDRNDVKNLIKKINKETDKVSAQLDKIEIETEVKFKPKWDITDTFEDIINNYKE